MARLDGLLAAKLISRTKHMGNCWQAGYSASSASVVSSVQQSEEISAQQILVEHFADPEKGP